MNLLSEMTKEEFHLFNPAYCGYLLYRTIFEYQYNSKKEFPCSLIYLILPLLMTKHIAGRFPKDTRTTFLSWSQDNQDCFSDLDTRVADYFNVTQCAINFLLEFKIVSISEEGFLTIAISKISSTPSFFRESSTMSFHLSKANFLGKWLGNYRPATIYSILGIRP